MTQLDQFLQRAEALLARIESILPQSATSVEWDKGVAFRWRRRNGNNGGGNSDRGSVRYSGGNYDAHVRACFNRYRSYDEETNSFMGYDGVRHECTL